MSLSILRDAEIVTTQGAGNLERVFGIDLEDWQQEEWFSVSTTTTCANLFTALKRVWEPGKLPPPPLSHPGMCFPNTPTAVAAAPGKHFLMGDRNSLLPSCTVARLRFSDLDLKQCHINSRAESGQFLLQCRMVFCAHMHVNL